MRFMTGSASFALSAAAADTDDLLKQFGGPAIPATGFGIGDCVLAILLEEKGLLKRQLSPPQPDYFVAVTDKQFFPKGR